MIQEGVELDMQDLIVKSVSKAILSEVKHCQFGFTTATPLVLLKKIKEKAEPVEIILLNTLLKEHKEQIGFKGKSAQRILQGN